MSLFDFIKRDEVETCDECRCLVQKSDAQVVEATTEYGQTVRFYYCRACRKPYDAYGCDPRGQVIFFKNITDRKIAVDEEGKPIEKDWYKYLLR